MKRRAVFLDRDGTLNRERGFVRSPDELEVLPGVSEALERLRAAGFLPVVLTNQSGIARGLYSEVDLAQVHAELDARTGHRIAAYFHCPHHPEAIGHPYGGECTCRKPRRGLLAQAVEVLGLSLPDSWLVGDSARDLLPARGLPLRTVLVQSGKPWEPEVARLRAEAAEPTCVVADLAAAAAAITGAPSATSSPCAPPSGT